MGKGSQEDKKNSLWKNHALKRRDPKATWKKMPWPKEGKKQYFRGKEHHRRPR